MRQSTAHRKHIKRARQLSELERRSAQEARAMRAELLTAWQREVRIRLNPAAFDRCGGPGASHHEQILRSTGELITIASIYRLGDEVSTIVALEVERKYGGPANPSISRTYRRWSGV